MKFTINESSLLNYTTLSDPFEPKGTTWTEVIGRHGRERRVTLAHVTLVCHGTWPEESEPKQETSCHGGILTDTTRHVNSTRNAFLRRCNSLAFSLLSLLTMANWC